MRRSEEFRQLLKLCQTYVKQRLELEGFQNPHRRDSRESSLSRLQSPVEDDKESSLSKLRSTVEGCRECPLWRSRKNPVFGEGNPEAQVVFVGEAPGREEDLEGRPFVGAAGKLLTKMIESIGLRREEVYIANVLKCRPPGNRDPCGEEVGKCSPYLKSQLEIIGPKVICALGTFAAQALLGTHSPISELRTKVFDYQGTKLVPTYHPAALIYHPKWKRGSWEDLKLLRRTLDRTRPTAQAGSRRPEKRDFRHASEGVR